MRATSLSPVEVRKTLIQGQDEITEEKFVAYLNKV